MTEKDWEESGSDSSALPTRKYLESVVSIPIS